MRTRLYGTSYFDLHKNKKYIQYLNIALKKYGVNNPISRLSDYEHFDVLEEAEKQIAKDLGCEDACLFSSGSLACSCLKNHLLIRAEKNGEEIFYSSNYHPSWIDKKMKDAKYLKKDKNDIFISNSLNSFYGEKENYIEYVEIFNKVAIDVSHTAYIWNHKKEANSKMLFFGSLNKAPSFPAGFVAGSSRDIQEIKKLAEYTTSTPPSIAFANAFLKMSKIRQEQLKKLEINIKIMDNALKIDRDNPFPIYNMGISDESLYKEFKNNDFDVSYMPYPFEYSDKHLRIVLNSEIREFELYRLIDFIRNN